jgi:hypothetical protein
LFLSFDDTPLGAASLAQVHKAVLHDGRTVAVKVQHPKVQAQSSKDILLMEVGAPRFLSCSSVLFFLRSQTASQIVTQAGGWTVASEEQSGRGELRHDPGCVIPWCELAVTPWQGWSVLDSSRKCSGMCLRT